MKKFNPSGVITLESSEILEVEVDSICGIKLLSFLKKDYPYLKQGDLVDVYLRKIGDRKLTPKDIIVQDGNMI